MTNEELKEALINRRPIVANITVSPPRISKIEYAFVSAIIYRRNNRGGFDVSAEIMDKCLHSVSIVDPKDISYKEGWK